MHIDHSKLVELLAEAGGIEADKVEDYLATLVSEIQEALSEGDAYEVDGLGVFSGIGNNIVFIPSDDLATEINYKYVGMEPIEMESGPSIDEDEPQNEPEDDDDELEDDPFAGLLDDEDDQESGGSSFVEDLINDEFEDPDETESSVEPESEVEETPEPEEETEVPPFDLGLEETGGEEEPEEEKPGPDKWGIDTYKDDSDAGMFSGLLGDKEEESAEEKDKDDDLSSIFDDTGDEEVDLEAEISKQLSEDEPDDIESGGEPEDVTDSDNDKAAGEDDFEDPFDSIEEEDDSNDEEVIPVITNLASESAKKKRQEEEEKESDEKDSEEQSKVSRSPSSRDANRQPVLLWVLLVIIIFAGGTYGLGYFGVVNIPGITPEKPQMAVTQPPQPQVQQPVEQETNPADAEAEQTVSENQQPAAESQPEEQAAEEQPSQTQVSQSNTPVPEGQAKYGLRGVTNSEANDGYTIVVFSLSNEENARRKVTELNNDGYRALLVSIPSQQYGQLWRVSLGQFESLRTAALAADTLQSPFSESYFITKIK